MIVGTGLSGTTIGNLLSYDNDITIIDSSSVIGGNCYDCRDKNGIMIHEYGSHIFHTDDSEVWYYLSKFTSFNDYRHKVIANIDGIMVPIPFNFNSIRKVFPAPKAQSIITKLLNKYPYGSRIPIKKFLEQEDDELKSLSDFIYNKVFLHYTEKQWGISPEMIDAETLSRVPIFISDDDYYFQDKYQGIPTNGYSAMIGQMIRQKNITLKLNTSFDKDRYSEYDMIFYTGSIDELLDYRYGVLPYRSLRFEVEEYNNEHYQINPVINYPNDHDYTRIHEYKYYLNDKSDKTIIAKEYPQSFIPGKNKRFYPIRTAENVMLYKKYLKEAKKRYPNMHFLGRLGDYMYYDMDDSVRRAIDVYREIIQ